MKVFNFFMYYKYMNCIHRWNYNTIISENIRDLIIKEIKMFIDLNKHIRLKGLHNDSCICWSFPKPTINKELIYFNGLEDPGEAFIFNFDHIQKNGYCNTYRRPYDLIVKLTLLSISNHILNFKFSSDETYEQWQEAIGLYTQYLGNMSLDFSRHNFREISCDFV